MRERIVPKKSKEIKILFVFLKHKIIISEVILITTDSDNGKWEVPRVKINWFDFGSEKFQTALKNLETLPWSKWDGP